MATITRYVNTASTAGGNGTTNATSGDNRAYASLNEWEAAEQTDLDTANNIMLVYCEGTAADTNKTTVDGWTTSATDYIDIRGNNTSGKWDTTKYRLYSDYNDGNTVLVINESNVFIRNMQVFMNSTGYDYASGACSVNEVGNVRIEKSVFINNQGRALSEVDYGANPFYVINSVIVSYGYGGASASALSVAHYTGNDDLWFVENCVIAKYGTAGDAATAGSNSGARSVAKNSYAYSQSGTAWAVGDSGEWSLTNCASDDGSQSTTTVAYSTSSGAYFTNVTEGSEDFHVTNTSSAFYQAGTDLSGTFTDDIDGDTRTTWDIGVDYITSGAPTTTVGQMTPNTGYWGGIVASILLGISLLFGCAPTTNILDKCCELDREMTLAGWHLKCTETIGNECITHQWFNEL